MINNTISQNSHYNDKYFEWQKKSGNLEAKIDLWKFNKYIDKDDVVLDFGCGGGFILNALNCKSKYGIEINEFAVKEAKSKGINIFKSVSDIPKDLKFDKIISNHALEHVDQPLNELIMLFSHLNKNGKIIFYLPFDSLRFGSKYKNDDINQHLYTWNPQLAGNIFSRAGFKISKIEIVHHSWPPKSDIISKFLPKKLFDIICFAWSYVIDLKQVKVVAELYEQ